MDITVARSQRLTDSFARKALPAVQGSAIFWDSDVKGFAAPVSGVTSGDGVVIGAIFGVASKTAAAGDTVTIATEGVFELPKLASAVIAAGAKVSWDDTAKQVNAPGTGRYPIGTAIETAGNGTATVRVRLDGIATTAA